MSIRATFVPVRRLPASWGGLPTRYSHSSSYSLSQVQTIRKEFPAVTQLPVHLEHEQNVCFTGGDIGSLRRASQTPVDSKLTAYFKANQRYPAARSLLYAELPSQFTWHHDTHEWKPRKQRTAHSRLSFIPPNAGEKYYARLILSVVKNLQGFDDLRSFDGVIYPTIRDACHARALLDDDFDLERCLEEATHLRTGPSLRSLFLSILLFSFPAQPVSLWDKFKIPLCDDLKHDLARKGVSNPSNDLVYDYGLYLLECEVASDGNRTLKDVGLSSPQNDWETLLGNHYLMEHRTYDSNQELQLLLTSLPLLNAEQRQAFNTILDCVLHKTPRIFFVEGAAGAGKTFLYMSLCHVLRSREMIALCVASSGIAAQLLTGGRTAHSSFKIPIDLFIHSTCSLSKHGAFSHFLKSVHVIIWDECSMQHRHAFEAVDRTLQDLLDNPNSFGGIPVVLGGDFLQTLPVVPRGSRSATVHACVLSSPLWPYIAPNVLKLERNMRLTNSPEDRDFAQWQRQLARGEFNNANDKIELPEELLCSSNTVEELLAHTYPDIATPHDDTYFLRRCILCPRNVDVRGINDSILESFPGTVHELWSVDKALDPEDHATVDINQTPEHLHSITPSGYPLALLKLKIGCPVIILRNLQPLQGIVNGTRGIVTRICRRVLEIRLPSGTHALIPRVKLISVDPEVPYHHQRLQFPVALAFAMTINKAQGQSFDTVGVDLRNSVFTHGQLYVALSRARSVHSIKCLVDVKTSRRHTTNIVFKEVII